MSKGETGQLRLLTGLVLLPALGCLVWAVLHLDASTAELRYPAIAVALIMIGNGCSAPVRIRTQIRLNSTSAAVLVTAVVLPGAWVVVCTALGVTAVRAVARYSGAASLHKAVHNVSKDVLGAAAAAYAVTLAGVTPSLHDGVLVQPWSAQLLALLCAALAFAGVEEVITTATVALATGRHWRQVMVTDWDIRLGINLASLVLAAAAIALIKLDARLMVAIPLAQLILYFGYLHRLHLRVERRTWEELAAATDALNTVDLGAVLRTAASRAVTLFAAPQVEVELWDPEPPRLVRADADGVCYDGPPLAAPKTSETTTSHVLAGPDRQPVGVLRLHLRAPDRLSGREHSTLGAYSASLATAIRNARAYDQLTTLAAQHAADARRDPLTGLANRRALMDLVPTPERPAARGGITALVLVDLNRFKEINDTLGHAAGDELLRQVGTRLRGAADEAGAVVARLGGDEFAILLGDLPAPAAAAHRARQLLDAVQQPVAVAGMRLTVRASAGVALAGPEVTAGELLRRADVAMYQAKRAGVAVAEYRHSRDTANHRRLALGGELPAAVADGQFTVHFQPIVDIATGRAVGVEALTRWEHPRHGLLPPAQWLSLIERSDLLGAFTAGVLDRALKAARRWRGAGTELTVAVNVSPHSLLDPHFPELVQRSLEAHRLQPGRLLLELAETTSVTQLQQAEQRLAELRAAGIRLALDDFGTGNSSLTVLSRVAVDQLKIDRTFVAAMGASSEAQAVVRSTIELGRTLGLDVVAEGVETERQRRTLWEFGCGAGQGNLFGKPVPAGELLARLTAGVDGVPSCLAPPIHAGATVIPLHGRHRPA